MKFFKTHDLLTRSLWMLFFMAILIVGQNIILPGLNPALAKASLKSQTFLQMFGIATGGQFTLPTIFSLGLGPYMTGMILWQAVTSFDFDFVKRLSKNQAGYFQKVITLLLAIAQSYQITKYLNDSLVGITFMGVHYGKNITSLMISFVLVAGSMLTVFLGDLNSDKGLGGISALIIPGIILGTPALLRTGWGDETYALTPNHLIIAGIVTVILTIIFIMLFQIELRIPVKKPMLEGNGSESYIPFKLLIAGSMPFMFSSTLFMVPRGIIQGKQSFYDSDIGSEILMLTDYHTLTGIITYGLIILILTYAFGFITVQPLKIAKQMKENNDYIVNVFPGEPTKKYLMRRFMVLGTLGGICLAIIGIIPMLIGQKIHGVANYTLYLGTVFILITVMQALIDQVSALYTKKNYHIF